MDLYSRMGKELRLLFVDLFNPKRVSAVREKMAHILATAEKIGEPIAKEARLLNEDVASYLGQPGNKKHIETMKKHALRLEQETREL